MTRKLNTTIDHKVRISELKKTSVQIKRLLQIILGSLVIGVILPVTLHYLDVI